MEDVINLNTAERDELTRLPGVGPAMADRIIASRPYENIEDLREVNGVGPTLFERIQPLLTLEEASTPEDVTYPSTEASTQPEPDLVEETDEGILEVEKEEIIDFTPEDETPKEKPESEQAETPEMEEAPEEEIVPKEAAIILDKEKVTEKEKPAKTPKPVTLGQVFVIAGICSFVAFILAVLLGLGIIGSINNGLNYASTEQVQHLSQQINGLESQINVLLEDIDSLRARIDNLEGVTARIGELETQADELAAEMLQTVGVVEEMNAQIAEIVDDTNRFQSFLEGLGELLDSLISEPQEVP